MGRFCPPCDRCAFKGTAKAVPDGTTVETIMSREAYGCVSVDPGTPVRLGEEIGVMRSDGFHPRTPEGEAYHRTIDAPF